MITAEQIDSAAEDLMRETIANGAETFSDAHPSDDAEGDEVERHRETCDWCQILDALEDSDHANRFGKYLILERATGERTEAGCIGAAVAFGIRVGLRIARQRDEQLQRELENEGFALVPPQKEIV